MATIQKRGNSYLIRVSCGYDVKGKQVIQSMTWKPTAKQIEKSLTVRLFFLRRLVKRDRLPLP